jgi:hypothetical protein
MRAQHHQRRRSARRSTIVMRLHAGALVGASAQDAAVAVAVAVVVAVVAVVADAVNANANPGQRSIADHNASMAPGASASPPRSLP